MAAAATAKLETIYIGTYTDPTGSQGIYSAQLNTLTGEITNLNLGAVAENPSFLAIHPSG
jgi:6-phosphogluconolactonase